MTQNEKPNRSSKKSTTLKRSATATRGAGAARARNASRPAASSGTGVPPSPTQPPRSDAPAGTPAGTPSGKAEAVRTSPSDAGKPGADAPKAQPSLFFAQPRTPLDNNPADRGGLLDPSGETTGDANLTSHLNDPAMRRAPPTGPAPDSTGASHSDISPLARDGVTPADEDARRAQDLHDADQRGRLKGLAPRADVQDWRESEKEQQSDLPGQPRKL